MASLSSRNPSTIPSLRWPLLFALLAAIVFFVGASTVRETYRGWKVDQEIEGLKSQVSQLEGQKHSMTELLGTMKTDAYIEQEARLRFNLKKPGEQVVLFEEGDSNTRMAWTEQSNATSSPTLPRSSASVPKRWLEYFLNPRETRS